MNSEQDNITLRHYLEKRLDVYIQAHAREHELIDKALGEDKNDMTRRLEGMNEFRAQLDKQATTFCTKTELSLAIRPLQQFADRFAGVIAGLTALNVVVTYLIIRLLSK